jgi:hypothetical protein
MALAMALGTLPAHATDPQAEADIRKVLRAIAIIDPRDPTTSRRIETVLADEALMRWQQGQFLRDTDHPESIRVIDEQLAVARYRRQGRVPFDAYVYLTHDPVWRVIAARSMERIDMLVDAKAILEGIWFRTPEQNARLANFRLALATDRELRQWFDRHRQELDAMVQTYRQAVTTAPSDHDPEPGFLFDDAPQPAAKPLTEAQIAAASDIATRCAALNLKGIGSLADVEMFGHGDQEPVMVTVGGVLDDTVGFVHAPAGEPPIAPNRLIWVEPLGGDWYLVRTT